MPKKRISYSSVSLPEELVKNISDFIDKNGSLGFTSIAEFVKSAARDKLIQLTDKSAEVII